MTGRRIHLIHWNAAEAAERLRELKALGYEARWQAEQGGPALRVLCAAPPEAFVIDLTRAPGNGCAVGMFLRQRRATRTVPLIFAGGTPEGVSRARKVLPDALYASWDRIATVLEEALGRPRTDVVVPKTMDLWAGRPLPVKLGVRAGVSVRLFGAPAGFERRLGPLPRGGDVPLILVFARSQRELAGHFQSALREMGAHGRVWLIWPKQSAGAGSDVTLASVRGLARTAGLAESKICAIDEDWSGLLYTRPRK